LGMRTVARLGRVEDRVRGRRVRAVRRFDFMAPVYRLSLVVCLQAF
jgi:hypothetical protein